MVGLLRAVRRPYVKPRIWLALSPKKELAPLWPNGVIIDAMVSTGTSWGVRALDGSDTHRRDRKCFPGANLLMPIRRAALCVVAIAFVIAPCLAQKGSAPQPPSGGRAPIAGSPSTPITAGPFVQPDGSDPFEAPPVTTPGVLTVTPDTARIFDAEACNSWTESGVHSPTVSVARLEVPDKASSEFQKGCSSYKDKKYSQAEGHVRKAIEIYPEYAAGWVLLGQVLDAQHNREDARKACSQAATVDPKYVVPYLCLAEFAARDEDWNTVFKLSDEALALDPVSNVFALYYSADANFHLQHLPDAERSARSALELDPWHHLPQLHLLLAHIYAAKGDPQSQAKELKDYLKMAPNSPDAPGARSTLSQLESPPPKQP